jgi:parvulin-like peptidyl-prolyl isomerase
VRVDRPVALLAAGALAGLAVAAAGLLARSEQARAVPDGAVAAVNGTPVRVAEYERAVAALASDRRSPIDDADKRHVLDRLVDEELLVQRALELGLARTDRRVRTDLVAAVIESVTADAGQREPTADEVKAFYDGNRDYFAEPGRLQVAALFVRAADAADAATLARARDAAARWRTGADPASLQAALGPGPVAPVPAALLPPSKLREYLGPAAVEALGPLAPGDVSEPVRAAGGLWVLRLVAREPGRVPPLAEIEPEVRAECRRRAGDRALRAYLDDLRRHSAVAVEGSLP